MAGADIVIDQLHSQSAGIAALEMLASGKVVLTGATNAGMAYNPAFASSPAVDAPPDPDRLLAALHQTLDAQPNFGDLARRGRDYVLQNHEPTIVARQFLSNWRQRICEMAAVA